MEAVGKYAFQRTSDDELSFSKGSTLKILNNTDIKAWYKAEMNGREGYIPSNYVTLRPTPFATKLGRDESEAFLLNPVQYEGSFIIRPSTSSPGDFTLSVKAGDGVQHFKILRDGGGKYFLWIKKFDSINALIKYHEKNSVSRSQTLLLQDLASPLPINDLLFDCKVVAKYDFVPRDSTELEMRKGDIITILSKNDENWWQGEIERDNQKYQGDFPMNYVETFPDDKNV